MICFNTQIKLISTTKTENEIGDSIIEKTSKEVFAEKKSIKQSEFYQAAAIGIRPELVFVIWEKEYLQEPIIEFENKEYKVIRTYVDKAKRNYIEIVCQGVVNEV